MRTSESGNKCFKPSWRQLLLISGLLGLFCSFNFGVFLVLNFFLVERETGSLILAFIQAGSGGLSIGLVIIPFLAGQKISIAEKEGKFIYSYLGRCLGKESLVLFRGARVRKIFGLVNFIEGSFEFVDRTGGMKVRWFILLGFEEEVIQGMQTKDSGTGGE